MPTPDIAAAEAAADSLERSSRHALAAVADGLANEFKRQAAAIRAVIADHGRLVEELRQARERIAELESASVESWEAMVRCEGVHVTEGKRAGWWDTCALSHVQSAADELVKLGLWERHPDGYGRRWFYRPVESDRLTRQ